MKTINLDVEKKRISQLLRKQLETRISESGGVFHGDVFPSSGALSVLGIQALTVSASDAALIIEIFDAVDRLHAQAIEATDNFMRETGRIAAAEYAYQDPRVKKTSEKALAATRSLGIKAKPENRDRKMYDAYLRFAPFKNTQDKTNAISIIAERDSKDKRTPQETTTGAVFQAIKREIKRRRAAGEPVPETLPRST